MNILDFILTVTFLGFFIISVCVLLTTYCVFIKDRRTPIYKVTPIVYLPEITKPELLPELDVVMKPPNKREIRRIKISKFLSDWKERRSENTAQRLARWNSRQIEIEDNVSRCFCFSCPKKHVSISRELINKSESVKYIADVISEKHVKKKKIKKNKEKEVIKVLEESKTSIPIDNVNSKSSLDLVDMNYELPEGASLIDIEQDAHLKTNIILSKRKKRREDMKLESIARGEVDVVLMNSGPPKHLLPYGYVTADVAPELTSEALVGKRVMYLWEGSRNPRCNGWFLGSISSQSKMAGCNFNIKYDSFETGSVFVNGIENCFLAMSGENAYGKRWVLLRNADTS